MWSNLAKSHVCITSNLHLEMELLHHPLAFLNERRPRSRLCPDGPFCLQGCVSLSFSLRRWRSDLSAASSDDGDVFGWAHGRLCHQKAAHVSLIFNFSYSPRPALITSLFSRHRSFISANVLAERLLLPIYHFLTCSILMQVEMWACKWASCCQHASSIFSN